MKTYFSTIVLLIAMASFASNSNALPARRRMVYYQQPSQWYNAPQRMMYVQYMQPSGGAHARSAQAASALVAGESVATGTYLEDCNHAQADIAAVGPALDVDVTSSHTQIEHQSGEDALSAAGAHSAHSVAEAYPDNFETVKSVPVPSSESHTTTVLEGETSSFDAGQVSVDLPAEPAVSVSTSDDVSITATISKSDDEAKVPREFNFGSNLGTTNDAYAPVAPADVVPEHPLISETVSTADDISKPQVPEIAEPAETPVVALEEPAPEPAQLPAPEPIAPAVPALPAVPARRYLPSKKKVFVELEHSSSEDTALNTLDSEADNTYALGHEEEVEEEETDLVPVAPKHPSVKPSARRPVLKKPLKPTKGAAVPDCASCAKAAGSSSRPQQLPAGTFFPIDFGGTAGGAIAIANSFSTGEGGSATSHAVAYGSPEAARTRIRPSKLH